MVLREITVTQYTNMALHMLVENSTSSTGRWICEQQFLVVGCDKFNEKSTFRRA
jgi:hypothetical protein